MGKKRETKVDDRKQLLLMGMLADTRLAANLKQSDVSTKLGKPQSYISKIELGTRRMDVIEFVEIMNAMDVDPILFLAALIKEFESQK